MAVKYTEEQLNTADKSLLIQMILNQQEQMEIDALPFDEGVPEEID